MRWVIARVLPVPAPARMQTGPAGAVTAVRCSGSSPASTASVRTRESWHPGPTLRRKAQCHVTRPKGFLTDVDHVFDVLVRLLPPAQVPARPRRDRL